MTIILLLIASLAQASGTSIGNGRVACREGARDTMIEPGYDGKDTTYTTYTCVRGQWLNLAAQPAARAAKPVTCREGKEEYFPKGGEEYSQSGRYVCRHGRYVPVFESR